jgi:hypothetical protein
MFTTLPFTFSQNTTEATQAVDDPECFGLGRNSVWFEFTPETDVSVLIDTFGSDYDTTLSVYTESSLVLTQIACDDDNGSLQSGLIFNASAGTSYLIMVASFDESEPPGGNLVLTAKVTPVTLSVAPKGAFDPHTGTASVEITATCTSAALLTLSGANLQQRAGRLLIQGFGAVVISKTCDKGSPVTFDVPTGPPGTFPNNGFFRGGPAQFDSFVNYNVGPGFFDAVASGTVKL